MASFIRKLSRRFTFGKGDDLFDDLALEAKADGQNDDDDMSQPTATQLTRKKSIFQKTFSRLSMSRNADDDVLGGKKKRRFSLFNLFGGDSKGENSKGTQIPDSNTPAKNQQGENIKAMTTYFSTRGTKLGSKKPKEEVEDAEENRYRSPIPSMKQQKKGSIQPKGDKKKSAKLSGRYTKRSLRQNVLDSSDMLSSFSGSNTKRINKTFSLRATGISKNEAVKHASLSLKTQNQVLARELPVLYQSNDTDEQKEFYNIETSPEETFSFTYKTTAKRELQNKTNQKQSPFTPFLPQKTQEDSNIMFDVYSASANQHESLSKTSRKSLRKPLAPKSEPLSLSCDIVLGKGQIILRFPERMSKFYSFEIANLENIIYAPSSKKNSKDSLSFSLKFLSRNKGDNADDSLFTFTAETQEEIENFVHALFIEIDAQTTCFKNVLNELVGGEALKLFLSEGNDMNENVKANVLKYSSQVENILRTIVDLTHLRVGLYHPESAELQFVLGNYLQSFRTTEKASEIGFWLELSQVSETKFAIKNNPRLQAGFDDEELFGLEKIRHQAKKNAVDNKNKVEERDLTTRTEAIVSWLKYTSANSDESEGEVQALEKEDLEEML